MADDWADVASPVGGGGDWDGVASPVSASTAPEAASPAQTMAKSWGDEPGYTYGNILPYRQTATGKAELAYPEMIRSPMRGVAELMSGAAGETPAGGNLSPDALGVVAGLSPASPAGALTRAAEIPATAPKPPSVPLPQQRAQDIVGRALKEENIDPSVVAANLTEAQKLGLPVRALDVATRQNGDVVTQGRNLMGLADVAANQPGPGSALAGQVSARVLDQTKQIGAMLDKAVSDKNIYSIKDDALRAIDENAAPAYERAFASGDKTPIQQQLGQQLREIQQSKRLLEPIAGGMKRQFGSLQEQIAEAERMAKDTFTYGNLGKKKLEELKQQASGHASGHGAVSDTIGKLSNQEAQITDLMQKVQDGTATFAPGAVWSPRVQEFLSDPDISRGMRGELLNLQKEAVGQGTPFNPKDYGITGYDEAGVPIVAQVPNMRMLDAGKKALDAMIEQEQNPLTGKLTRKGKALTIQKKGYVKELDRLNPDYAEARQAYADQASRLRASQQGRNYMRMDKEEIANFFDDPSTSNAEKAYFSAGVRRDLQDSLDRVRDGSSSINQIWKENVRGRLEPIFPDKEAFDNFSKNMVLMQDMQRTNNTLARGSQTAPRQMFKEDFQQTPLSGLGKVVAGVKMMVSPATQIPKAALDMMSNKIAEQVKGLDRETAGEIMNILLTDDPKKWEAFSAATKAAGSDDKSMMYALGVATRNAPAATKRAVASAIKNAPPKLKRLIPSTVIASPVGTPHFITVGPHGKETDDKRRAEEKSSGGSVAQHRAMMDYPWNRSNQ